MMVVIVMVMMMVVTTVIDAQLNLHCICDAVLHDGEKQPTLAVSSHFRISGGEFQFTKHFCQQGKSFVSDQSLYCFLIWMFAILGLNGLAMCKCPQIILWGVSQILFGRICFMCLYGCFRHGHMVFVDFVVFDLFKMLGFKWPGCWGN